MTSRERLLSALAIGPTDRVPISTYELVGFDEHSWYNQQASYAPLMDLVREKTDCLYMAYLPGPRLSNPADAVRTTDGSPEGDCVEYREHRQGASRFIRTVYHTSKGDLSSEHRIDDDIYTTWTLEHLLKTIDDLDRYLAISWELPELDLSGFAETQRRLGDRGIMMPSLSDPICVAADLYEMGQFLILALTETDRMRYLLDVEHERQMAHLRAVLEAGRKAGVDWTAVVFRICGPEYATPPYLGPEHFAMFVTPYVRRMSDLLHEYGAKMRLHSHGKIARVLDEASNLADWVKDLQAYVLAQLCKGEKLPGWKLVEKSTNRAFTDQAAAFEAVKNAGYDEALLYERKPLTLAGVEKLIGKKTFATVCAPYVFKPKGEPILARASDKRPEMILKLDAKDIFKPASESSPVTE